MTEQSKGLLFASITAICWGFLAIILKVALDFIDSYSIVWMRFTVAFVLLAGFYLIKDPKAFRIFKEFKIYPYLSAIFLALNYIGYMKGIEYTTPSNTQIVIQLGPILLALSGFFLFKETLGKIQALGFICSLIGFGLFYQDQLGQMLGSGSYNKGVFLVVLAAIAWAIYAIFQKFATKEYSPGETNLLLYAVGFLCFIFQSDFPTLTQVSWFELGILIFLGLNTLIAYGCLGEALKRAPANKISIIITLNPLITIFVMNVLAQFQVSWIKYETITIQGYLGAFLVVLGAILIVRKKR